MTGSEEVIGTQEAAQRLGVSVRTVQLWVEKGTLQAWKTSGGHRRILRSSVDAAIRDRDTTLERRPTAAPRVLIVEDDATMQSYYAALLEILNPDAELILAADGYEGLIALGSAAPDLMLVDVDMPGMDGISMLKKIGMKEIGGAVKIAVVTGLSAAQLEDRGGVPAGIPIFSKPLNVDSLSALLKDLARAEKTRSANAGGVR
jgi:excisionase family DNA binding protein